MQAKSRAQPLAVRCFPHLVLQEGLGSDRIKKQCHFLQVLFCTFWYGLLFLGFFFGQAVPDGVNRIVGVIFSIPFVLGGLFPAGLGLLALFGRMTVEINRDRLSCRWSVGPLGWTKSLPTNSITQIAVYSGAPLNSRKIRMRRQTTSQSVCNVWAGTKFVPLTLLYDEATNRQLAALIRTKLSDLGFPRADS